MQANSMYRFATNKESNLWMDILKACDTSTDKHILRPE